MVSVKLKESASLKKLMATTDVSERPAVRLAFRQVLSNVEEYARNNHKFTSRSGWLESAIESRVVSDNPLTGEVFVNPAVAPYGLWVHDGTKPHPINPVNKKVLRWVKGGNFVFAKRVNHPGTAPDEFLDGATEALRDSSIRKIAKIVAKELDL